jgi:hypothetical protein
VSNTFEAVVIKMESMYEMLWPVIDKFFPNLGTDFIEIKRVLKVMDGENVASKTRRGRLVGLRRLSRFRATNRKRKRSLACGKRLLITP